MGLFSRRSPEGFSPDGDEVSKIAPGEIKISPEQVTEYVDSGKFDEIFIFALLEKGRDKDGELFPTETKVIYNPDNPGLFMEDTPKNRREFAMRGFTWGGEKNSIKDAMVSEKIASFEDFSEGKRNSAIEFAQKTTELDNNIRELEKAERDVDGELFDPGTKVIRDRIYNELFKEDTPENRAEFVKKKYTWKEQEEA